MLCLDAASGEIVWQVDLRQRYRAPSPIWGFCSHPLVDGERLYVLAGGEGSVAVALDKRTGKELWRALSDADAGYSPPTMIRIAGKKQLAIWHPHAISGLEPETGKVLWSEKLEPNYGMSINPPCQAGDYLFVAGIVQQGLMLKFAGGEGVPSVAWRVSSKLGIGPVHSPVIPVGETMYGVNREGELTAFEIASGKKLWETYKATTGSRRASSATAFLVRNDDRFFIFSETGELIIARLSPEGYEELDRAKILEPTHEAFGRNVEWSPPAFARRAMFVRNNREIVCVSLAED